MLRRIMLALGLLMFIPLAFLSKSGIPTSAKQTIHSTAMWVGYYANHFTREAGKDLEKLSRPSLHFSERFKSSVQLLAHAPLSLLGIPLSYLFFSIADATSSSRLEFIQPQKTVLSPAHEREITLMSLNGCLQEGPFAPLTGGVVAPSESIGEYPSRTIALAEWIASSQLGSDQTSPDIFVGQEFHDIKAQDVFVEALKKHGYRYFILDRAPHAILNNSGLFVASKRELGEIAFTPFPREDRYGLAKGTQQGVLAFSVLDGQKRPLLRIFNTHLNYGDNAEHQEMRNKQLKEHILPAFSKMNTPAILVGDFNFDTSEPALKNAAGLADFVNVLEGKFTCSNEGKSSSFGRQEPISLEKLDALISNSQSMVISQVQVEQMQTGRALLSDHFSIAAVIYV